LVTEDAFFSHFYRFNHIILYERRRIPEKRAATGAVKVQIAAIRPRCARFLPGFLKSDLTLRQSNLGFLKSEVVWSRFARNLSNPSKSDILFLIYLCSICSDLWDFCPTRALRGVASREIFQILPNLTYYSSTSYNNFILSILPVDSLR
jgi:hypothetical protein